MLLLRSLLSGPLSTSGKLLITDFTNNKIKGQVDHNLRGKFTTNEEEVYDLYCLKPTPYPIPDDGKSAQPSNLPVLKTRFCRSGREIPLYP